MRSLEDLYHYEDLSPYLNVQVQSRLRVLRKLIPIVTDQSTAHFMQIHVTWNVGSECTCLNVSFRHWTQVVNGAIQLRHVVHHIRTTTWRIGLPGWPDEVLIPGSDCIIKIFL